MLIPIFVTFVLYLNSSLFSLVSLQASLQTSNFSSLQASNFISTLLLSPSFQFYFYLVALSKLPILFLPCCSLRTSNFISTLLFSPSFQFYFYLLALSTLRASNFIFTLLFSPSFQFYFYLVALSKLPLPLPCCSLQASNFSSTLLLSPSLLFSLVALSQLIQNSCECSNYKFTLLESCRV